MGGSDCALKLAEVAITFVGGKGVHGGARCDDVGQLPARQQRDNSSRLVLANDFTGQEVGEGAHGDDLVEHLLFVCASQSTTQQHEQIV